MTFPQFKQRLTRTGLGPSGFLSSIAARMIHSSLLAARSASSMLHLVNKNFYTGSGPYAFLVRLSITCESSSKTIPFMPSRIAFCTLSRSGFET